MKLDFEEFAKFYKVINLGILLAQYLKGLKADVTMGQVMLQYGTCISVFSNVNLTSSSATKQRSGPIKPGDTFDDVIMSPEQFKRFLADEQVAITI